MSRKWYFRYKTYPNNNRATLYSVEEDGIILVHRYMKTQASMANSSTAGEKLFFINEQMYPMTLAWVLENYPTTVDHDIPNSTYKQILEDLAHEQTSRL